MSQKRNSPVWIAIAGIALVLVLVGPSIIDMSGDILSVFGAKR